LAAYASHISPDTVTADTLQAVKMGWACSLRGQNELKQELAGKTFSKKTDINTYLRKMVSCEMD
jgi:hypothetical protein